MAKNKNRRPTPPAEKIPLVSVVIPMFNSAKFISQTLESLLYQTSTDFEVVVVDDCSTDDSVAVAKNFSERFGGRLHVVKLAENTGTPGLPRNVGIQISRGKYIAFLDSDDLFTKTALEELSTLAEKFSADVVRLQRNFVLWNGEQKFEDDPAFSDFAALTNPKNFSVRSYRKEISPEPTLEPEEISERVRGWVRSAPNDFWATWLHFYRRDFLIANQIKFSSMATCEDAPFAFEAMCLAKKFLRVPNVVNIIRPRLGSVSRDVQKISAEQHLHKRISSLVEGVNEFERVMKKIPFFRDRANYRYAVQEWFAGYRISITQGFYLKTPAYKLDELIRREFHAEDAPFAAYLFKTVNVYRLQLMKLQQELNALKSS